jgi:hypothetical protein
MVMAPNRTSMRFLARRIPSSPSVCACGSGSSRWGARARAAGRAREARGRSGRGAGVGFALTIPSRAREGQFLPRALPRGELRGRARRARRRWKRTAGIDIPQLIGDRVQVIEQNAPVSVVSREAASASAGFHVEMPTVLPEGTVLTEIKAAAATWCA